MADPITIGSILIGTGLFGTSVVGSAIGGLIESRADAICSRALQQIYQRLRRGDRPVNHDLQKAVLLAYLHAQRIIAQECLKERLEKKGFTGSLVTRYPDDVLWLRDTKIPQIEGQIAQAVKSEEVKPPIEALKEIELLVYQPNGNGVREQAEALKKRLLDELTAEEGLHDLYKQRLNEHFFSLMSAIFCAELKHNEQFRDIFQTQILAHLDLCLDEQEAQQPVSVDELTKHLQTNLEAVAKLTDFSERWFKRIEQGLEQGFAAMGVLFEEVLQQIIETEFRLLAEVRDQAELTRLRISAAEEKMLAAIAESYRKAQVLNPEDAESLKAVLDVVRETLRQQSQRAQEVTRDPIPIPIPRLRGTFVDREMERDTLHHLLRESDMRLVVIIAPGGYGKTELTVKVLKEVAPTTSIIDPDVQGILYLRCLRGDVSLGRIFEKAGSIVGKSEEFQQTYASRELTVERKLEFFFDAFSKAGNVWIVMDNFEDLLSGDDTIADEELRQFVEWAWTTEHTVRLIATTRAVPRFSGSHRLKPIDLRAGLPEDEAVKYLREEGADCGLADADDTLLRQLVNDVHRIPKALESVVGYLHEKYPVVQLSDLMANESLFADFKRYDSKKGLRSLIAEQFADQTPDAQLTLCVLSVFPKPASLAALRYLLPALDWATILPRLERNKLVIRQDSSYDLHPLVREYVYSLIPLTEGADANGAASADVSASVHQISGIQFTRSALHARAADFFRELRRPQAELKRDEDSQSKLDEFYHRVRAGEFDTAKSLLDATDLEHLQLWGEQSLVIAHQIGNLREEGMWSGSLGLAHAVSGWLQKAITYYEHALTIAYNIGDRHAQRAWLGNLGLAYTDLGEPQRAIDFYYQALIIARDIGDKGGEGNRLGNLGLAYSALGKPHQAIEFYYQALAIAHEIGDKRGEGNHLGNLGLAYSALGEPQRAIEFYEQAGDVYDALGQYPKAIEYYEQALKISREIGDRYNESARLNSLGYLHHESGNLAAARRFYEEAFALDIPTASYAYAVNLGILCLEEGKAEEAQKRFADGIALCRALLEETPNLYNALYNLAAAQLGSGQTDEAMDTYRRALEVRSEKGVVQSALRDLWLMERAAQPVAGLAAVGLLEERIRQD